jgi:murein DD-endopeptidase MepM/ murein hydrolase activator NlpD
MKQGFSIVLTATDSKGSRHFFIPRKGLYLIGAVALVIIIILVIATISYGRLSYKAVEAEVLRKRNADIEKEFEKIQEIKKNLEIVELNNKKLKTMLGIEKTPEVVQPVISDARESVVPSESIGGDDKNIPALMPTNGQISKAFEIGHEALDIAAPLFTPVIATAAGAVIETGWDSLYGNYVIIEHSRNYCTFYGHLNSIVSDKQRIVKPGEMIGTVGSSGRSTSPHLHYEIRFRSTRVDPMAYLPYYFGK